MRTHPLNLLTLLATRTTGLSLNLHLLDLKVQVLLVALLELSILLALVGLSLVPTTCQFSLPTYIYPGCTYFSTNTASFLNTSSNLALNSSLSLSISAIRFGMRSFSSAMTSIAVLYHFSMPRVSTLLRT